MASGTRSRASAACWRNIDAAQPRAADVRPAGAALQGPPLDQEAPSKDPSAIQARAIAASVIKASAIKASAIDPCDGRGCDGPGGGESATDRSDERAFDASLGRRIADAFAGSKQRGGKYSGRSLGARSGTDGTRGRPRKGWAIGAGNVTGPQHFQSTFSAPFPCAG